MDYFISEVPPLKIGSTVTSRCQIGQDEGFVDNGAAFSPLRGRLPFREAALCVKPMSNSLKIRLRADKALDTLPPVGR